MSHLSLKVKYLLLIGLCLSFCAGAIGITTYVSGNGFKALVGISAKNLDAIYKASELKSLLFQEMQQRYLPVQDAKTAEAFDKAFSRAADLAKSMESGLADDLKPLATEFISAHSQIQSQKDAALMPDLFKKANESLNNLSDMVLLGSQDQQETTIGQIKSKITYSLGLFGVLGLLLVIGAFFWTASLTRQLDGYASSLFEASQEFFSKAQQILSSSSSVGELMRTQTQSTAVTSSAIEEIGAMVARSAEGAHGSQQMAEKSAQRIKDGKQTVQEMVEAIASITRSTDQIIAEVESNSREFAQVVNIIKQIDQKTKVINEIVFQTKLLSFNASVEAARAGEQGKGFAVVAQEVGNLAQLSGNAAQEITQMLDNSVRKVEEIANHSKNSIQHLVSENKVTVSVGQEKATRCDEIFDGILGDSENVRHMLGDISRGADEQSKGVAEVRDAILRLETSASSTSDATDTVTTIARSVAEQAQSLSELVSNLRSTIKGPKAARSAEAESLADHSTEMATEIQPLKKAA